MTSKASEKRFRCCICFSSLESKDATMHLNDKHHCSNSETVTDILSSSSQFDLLTKIHARCGEMPLEKCPFCNELANDKLDSHVELKHEIFNFSERCMLKKDLTENDLELLEAIDVLKQNMGITDDAEDPEVLYQKEKPDIEKVVIEIEDEKIELEDENDCLNAMEKLFKSLKKSTYKSD